MIRGNVAVTVLRPHALAARGNCARLRFPAATALVQTYQVYGPIELNAREARGRTDLEGMNNKKLCYTYTIMYGTVLYKGYLKYSHISCID